MLSQLLDLMATQSFNHFVWYCSMLGLLLALLRLRHTQRKEKEDAR